MSWSLIDTNKKVEVYRNLHLSNRKTNEAVWSVRQSGKVVAHFHASDGILLVKDAELVVQPGGFKRAQKTRKRNVHAFVRGYFGGIFAQDPPDDCIEAVYLPFPRRHVPVPKFHTVNDLRMVNSAEVAILGDRLWLRGIIRWDGKYLQTKLYTHTHHTRSSPYTNQYYVNITNASGSTTGNTTGY